MRETYLLLHCPNINKFYLKQRVQQWETSLNVSYLNNISKSFCFFNAKYSGRALKDVLVLFAKISLGNDHDLNI